MTLYTGEVQAFSTSSVTKIVAAREMVSWKKRRKMLKDLLLGEFMSLYIERII